jgi:hypothetical protein
MAFNGDSAEVAALNLLVVVAKAEGVDLDKDRGGWSKAKILATYRECLGAVRSGSREPTPLREVS